MTSQSTQPMQEKDILSDLLVVQKSLCTAYGMYLIESDCPKERTLLTQNMTGATNDQYQTFDSMSKRGYYPTKDAPATEVNEAKKKYEGIFKVISE